VAALLFAALTAAWQARPTRRAVAAPAWWPVRDTVSCRKPAPCIGFESVVLDSITNYPGYGDERNFLRVKPASMTVAGGLGRRAQGPSGTDHRRTRPVLK
jgi:hypothetical protein